jgi:hypothetical protein
MFGHHFHLYTFYLEKFVSYLERAINSNYENLGRVGVACLQQLVALAGSHFYPSYWNTIIACYNRLFFSRLPDELLLLSKILVTDEHGSPSFSISSTKASSPVRQEQKLFVGNTYITSYGSGSVEGVREGDNIATVKLPFGTAYMNLTSVLSPRSSTSSLSFQDFIQREQNSLLHEDDLTKRVKVTNISQVLPNKKSVHTKSAVLLELVNAIGELVQSYGGNLSV